MSGKHTLLRFLKAHLKSRIRDSKFMVWIILMPIILMCFLNALGGNLMTEDRGINIHLVVLDEDDSGLSNTAYGLLRSQDKLDVKKVDSLQEGVDRIKSGKAEVLLVIPSDFSDKWNQLSSNRSRDVSIYFKVYYPNNEEIKDTIEYTLKGIISEMNKMVVEEYQEPIKVKSRTIDTGIERYTDLLVPGGIMIILLQVAVFSSSNSVAEILETNLMKRLRAGYNSPSWALQGLIFTDSMFVALASLIGLLTGLFLYKLDIGLGNLFLLSILLFLSSLVFTYLGHILGRFSSSTISAQALSSMLLFPLAFFGGAYIFSWIFPEYITEITGYLPIGPLVEGLKAFLFMEIRSTEVMVLFSKTLVWLAGFFLLFICLDRRE